LLVQAGLGDLRDGALITLLALNGLRISEALNADIDDLSTERGHRTLGSDEDCRSILSSWR